MSTSSQPILLVADPHEGKLLRRALELSGHPVLHRPTGTDAADWLGRGPLRPSLILIDWNVRGGDSARFLARQASDPKLSAVPVVVLADIPHMRHVPTLCVLATLAKPVRTRTLIEVIDRLLGRRPKNDVVDIAGGRPRDLATGYLRTARAPAPLEDGPEGTPRTLAIRLRSDDATVRMRALDDDQAPPFGSDERTQPVDAVDAAPLS